MRPAAKILALALLLAACAGERGFPHPRLSAAQVVRLQVQALAEHDIATTFRFASPANKRFTGPLERFVRIVEAPAYRPMLDHVAAEYGPLRASGDEAAQIVTVVSRDGSRHVYLFELSRQRGGEWDGCWMTDSVHTAEEAESPEPPGMAI